MSNEARAVQAWAWYEFIKEPRFQKYNMECNKSLIFDYLKSQAQLINPQSVTFALVEADSYNPPRLSNGALLAVKADERLAREAAEKAEADRKAQEEADKLALIAAQNEVFQLCKEISEYRGGNDPNIVAQELKRIQHWNLAQLREYKQGMERARAARGLSASEYKAQLAAERPAQHTNGYPSLPEKWNRTAIRTAPVQTLRTLMQKYGRKQLDARLQMEES